MPCIGCGKNVERVIVKLRFIGRPNGKLVRGAPGNYKQGEITRGPLSWVKVHPQVWELVESAPELKIPDATKGDSVFEDAVYIPDDNEELSEADLGDGSGRPTKDRVWTPLNFQTPETDVAEITLSGSINSELDARTKEVAEEYKKQGMYLLDADEGVIMPPEAEEKDTRSRATLMTLLDAAGAKYSKHSRTETLSKMVQKLESKEDG